ncbi:MAG: hypothetical protein KKA07_05795 [Bacteroidetes bacterium]|nr:hypothetical protein [Bacteroidota bacterium]MBU1718567.1 hypothetical protein [Bacteroidota bacterium]
MTKVQKSGIVFCILIFAVASIGIRVVHHTCVSCGISHSEYFLHTNDCCDCTKEQHSARHSGGDYENSCCTYQSLYLTLDDFQVQIIDQIRNLPSFVADIYKSAYLQPLLSKVEEIPLPGPAPPPELKATIISLLVQRLFYH